MSGVPVTVCEVCGRRFFPARLACPACGNSRWRREEVEDGVVEGVTIVRRAPGRALAAPVRLACVRLAGGPPVVARLAPGAGAGNRVRVELDEGVPVARPHYRREST